MLVFLYKMDLSFFPPDLIRYISTFLYVVSWRAEYHYVKLRNFFCEMRSNPRIPARVKVSLVEYPDHYTYPHPSGAYLTRAYKWDPPAIARMNHHYLNLYTDPLADYLSQYKAYHLNMAWSPRLEFSLFGYRVHDLSPEMYAFHLYNQGCVEAHMYSSWQGCLPLAAYKKACLSSIPKI